MPHLLPIYWGNRKWLQSDEGVIIPGDPISDVDPNWINYANIEGSSVDLCRENHPQSKFRKNLQDQIIDTIFGEHLAQPAEVPSCILTHGGIASGKTSAVDLFLQAREASHNYLRIDFDLMKRKLPEFTFMHERKLKRAAHYTQTESARLAGRLFKKAIRKRLNIIYEGSLAETGAITERIRAMREKDYLILILSTYSSERLGQERAVARFEAGGRFVPADVITETYLNCPQSLVTLKPLVDLVLMINNEEELSRPFLQINCGQVEILDSVLYAQYLQTVGVNYCLD